MSNGLKWDENSYKENTLSGVPPQRMTTNILIELMNKILRNLVFTGEDHEMFRSCDLPTIDTALFVKEGEVLYRSFEKDTCRNQVLNVRTAIDQGKIMPAMRQETVRRLSNTSLTL